MANFQPRLDHIYQALADPTRRAVVQRLAAGEATVTELAQPFDLALPSFLKHLSVLERSGLITSTKRGRVRTCSLERGSLEQAERWFAELRQHWVSRYGALDELLETLVERKTDV